MTILGIDPGTVNLGYGWIEIGRHRPEDVYARGLGTLKAPPRDDVATRLSVILTDFQKLVSSLRPSVVVIEKAFLGKNVESALVLGQARGVVMAVSAGAGARILEEAAVSAKKSVTGSGASEKTEVRLMLSRLLRLDGEVEAISLDASDALALAYCAWRKLCVESAAQGRWLEQEGR